MAIPSRPSKFRRLKSTPTKAPRPKKSKSSGSSSSSSKSQGPTSRPTPTATGPQSSTPTPSANTGAHPMPGGDDGPDAPDLPDEGLSAADLADRAADAASDAAGDAATDHLGPSQDPSFRNTAAQATQAVKSFISGDGKSELSVKAKTESGGPGKTSKEKGETPEGKGVKEKLLPRGTSGRAGAARGGIGKFGKATPRKRGFGNKKKLGQKKAAEKIAEDNDRDESDSTKKARKGKRAQKQERASKDREGDGRREREGQGQRQGSNRHEHQDGIRDVGGRLLALDSPPQAFSVSPPQADALLSFPKLASEMKSVRPGTAFVSGTKDSATAPLTLVQDRLRQQARAFTPPVRQETQQESPPPRAQLASPVQPAPAKVTPEASAPSSVASQPKVQPAPAKEPEKAPPEASAPSPVASPPKVQPPHREEEPQEPKGSNHQLSLGGHVVDPKSAPSSVTSQPKVQPAPSKDSEKAPPEASAPSPVASQPKVQPAPPKGPEKAPPEASAPSPVASQPKVQPPGREKEPQEPKAPNNQFALGGHVIDPKSAPSSVASQPKVQPAPSKNSEKAPPEASAPSSVASQPKVQPAPPKGPEKAPPEASAPSPVASQPKVQPPGREKEPQEPKAPNNQFALGGHVIDPKSAPSSVASQPKVQPAPSKVPEKALPEASAPSPVASQPKVQPAPAKDSEKAPPEASAPSPVASQPKVQPPRREEEPQVQLPGAPSRGNTKPPQSLTPVSNRTEGNFSLPGKPSAQAASHQPATPSLPTQPPVPAQPGRGAQQHSNTQAPRVQLPGAPSRGNTTPPQGLTPVSNRTEGNFNLPGKPSAQAASHQPVTPSLPAPSPTPVQPPTPAQPGRGAQQHSNTQEPQVQLLGAPSRGNTTPPQSLTPASNRAEGNFSLPGKPAAQAASHQPTTPSLPAPSPAPAQPGRGAQQHSNTQEPQVQLPGAPSRGNTTPPQSLTPASNRTEGNFSLPGKPSAHAASHQPTTPSLPAPSPAPAQPGRGAQQHSNTQEPQVQLPGAPSRGNTTPPQGITPVSNRTEANFSLPGKPSAQAASHQPVTPSLPAQPIAPVQPERTSSLKPVADNPSRTSPTAEKTPQSRKIDSGTQDAIPELPSGLLPHPIQQTTFQQEPVLPSSGPIAPVAQHVRTDNDTQQVLFRKTSASNESGVPDEPSKVSRLRQARQEAEAENRRVTFRRPGASEPVLAPDPLSALGQNYLYDLPLTPSDKRASVARKITETAALQTQKREETAVDDKPQISWSRHRGFGRSMDRTDKTDAEVLTREERIVHSELTKVLPKEAQLFGVHITDDTSKVQAQAVVRDQAEANRLYLASRTFEAQTGRTLELELLTTRPTLQNPKKVPYIDVAQTNTERRPDHEMNQVPERPLRRVEPEEVKPKSPQVVTLAQRLSAPREPIAEMIAAAIVASMRPNQQPSQPLTTARRQELGVPLLNSARPDTRIRVEGQQGGSLGSRRAPNRRSRRETDDEDGQSIFSKERGESRAQDALREAEELRRQQQSEGQGGKQQQHQHEEQGQRRQASNCSSCGTLLPENQVGACPVCAQSGPDVMALARIHYRSAGVKFLATVDAFTATDEAKNLILSGAAPAVASLRYEQEIVGHKDLLKFKVKS